MRLEDFGRGLNLVSGPLDPSYAIDCQDVTYGRAIRTRPGFSYLTSAATLYTTLHAHKQTGGTTRLLAARSGNTDALSTAGAVDYTTSKTFQSAVSFGSPGNEVVYLANGADTVFKFSGSAFSSPSGMPKAKYLAVQAPDNRLVATGFTAGANGPGGATVSESTVCFSNELDPELWTASSYVNLTPGDGEKVMGCAAWRGMVFVFKESKFFVFNGNTTDSAGLPRFNRQQRDGAGLVAPKAVATGPNGVYFLARDGIYVTNGGNPSRVLEQEMGPIFGETGLPFFSSGNVNQQQIEGAAATFDAGRLYVALPMDGSATNNRIVVVDTKFDWWSIYALPANDLTVWAPGGSNEIMFAHTANKIARHSDDESDDAGSPIPAFSRQAWIDMGSQVSMREIHAWGTGQTTVKVAVDYNPSAGAGVTRTLGAASDTWGGATWGGGAWGPVEGSYEHANFRGFGARGNLFSITFQGGGTPPMKLEQASCTFLGGRDQE